MLNGINAVTADEIIVKCARKMAVEIHESKVARRIAALPFCLTVAVMAIADIVAGTVVNVFALIKYIACLERKLAGKALIALIGRPVIMACCAAAMVIAAPFLCAGCLASDTVAKKFFLGFDEKLK